MGKASKILDSNAGVFSRGPGESEPIRGENGEGPKMSRGPIPIPIRGSEKSCPSVWTGGKRNLAQRGNLFFVAAT